MSTEEGPVHLVADRSASCIRVLPKGEKATRVVSGTLPSRHLRVPPIRPSSLASRAPPTSCSFAEARLHQLSSGKRTLDDECSICLTSFEPADRVTLMGCSHVFHDACIDQWLERSTFCPCCKATCEYKRLAP